MRLSQRGPKKWHPIGTPAPRKPSINSNDLSSPIQHCVLPLNCPATGAHALMNAQQEARVAAARLADVNVHAVDPEHTQCDRHMLAHTAQVIDPAVQGHAVQMVSGYRYYFGGELPPVLTEATPFVANTSKKAHRRIALKQAIQQAGEQHGLRSAVIRAGNFLAPAGQGETCLELAMGRKLAQAVYRHMSAQDVATAWAWLPDPPQVLVQVAGRRLALAAVGQPRHQVLHHAGHSPSDSELTSAVERVIGTRLRSMQFPWWVLWLMAPVSPMFAALFKMHYLSQRPRRLDALLPQALLGHPAPRPSIDVCLQMALAKRPVAAGQVARETTRRDDLGMPQISKGDNKL